MLVSEIVKRKLYPRYLHFDKGEPFLELGKMEKKELNAGFYVPDSRLVNESELVFIKLDELEFDIRPVCQPAGFIFHLGRCGSTLTAKMLNSLDNYQVIGEAEILHQLAKANHLKPIDNKLKRRKEILQLFCLLGEAENCKTLFKVSSWEVRLREEYSQIFPQSPCCLIVRNIVEIMVALLSNPPSRLQRYKKRLMLEEEKSKGLDDYRCYLAYTFGEEIDYLADQPYVDFIGAAIQVLLNDINKSKDPYLVIDHSDIVERVPTVLCAFFGITPGKQQIEKMSGQARYNSKKDGQQKKYTDDSKRKAAEATPETRRWCEKILQPMLDEIIQLNQSKID